MPTQQYCPARQMIGRRWRRRRLSGTSGSDGAHLAASADRYATATDDPAYRDVIDLFIREEQRHGALLGQILDDAGIPRRRADWGDTLFRRLRYSITDYVWT